MYVELPVQRHPHSWPVHSGQVALSRAQDTPRVNTTFNCSPSFLVISSALPLPLRITVITFNPGRSPTFHTCIKVQQRAQNHGDTERLASGGPVVVCWFFIPALHPSQAVCAIDYVIIPYQQIFETVLTRMLQSNQRITFPSKLALRDKNSGLIEDTTHPTFIGYSVTNRKVMNNDDTPSSLPSSGLDPTQYLPDPSIAIDSQEKAWQRLITRAAPHDELPSLIEIIFAGREADVVSRLRGNDAQTFIDIMDEVYRHTLLSEKWSIYFSFFYVPLFRH